MPKMDEPHDEGIVIDSPMISLPIEDAELLQIIKERISDSEKSYEDKYSLNKMRKLNEDFYLGKQIDESRLESFEQPVYIDNILYEDLETRIAIASGRLPDIIVTPSNNDDEAKQQAKILEDGLSIRINNDKTQRIIKDGLRQHHIYRIGCVKVRWDKNRGKDGDFVYELINPKDIVIDHTAKIPHDSFTADNMEIISEQIEEATPLVLSKFPEKKDQLLEMLGQNGKKIPAKIRYQEVWFTWYTPEGEIVEGVCWKYNNMILDKSKNPYYDFKGYEKTNMDEMGQYNVDQVFNNFFDRPRKPYIFFSYQNLGFGPMDNTTPFEQAIPLQRIVNKRGRQITEISDNAVPKKVFGLPLSKDDAAGITNDPKENVYINTEDVTKAFGIIPAVSPNPLLYQDQNMARMRIDSKMSTNPVTKGEAQPGNQSGISKQISREGDLVQSDDIVNIMVERVIWEMAQWAVQMMKVFYDTEHFVRNSGSDGKIIEAGLKNDRIDDGVLVNIKANSTDKITRRNQALELAKMKAIDPLTMFEDLDVPNPKERTGRLIAFLQGTADGWAKYMEVIGMMDQVGGGNTIPGQLAPTADQIIGRAGVAQPGASPMPGQQPTQLNPANQETPVQENIPKG